MWAGTPERVNRGAAMAGVYWCNSAATVPRRCHESQGGRPVGRTNSHRESSTLRSPATTLGSLARA